MSGETASRSWPGARWLGLPGLGLLGACVLALAACSDKPLPVVVPSPGPDDQAAPAADRPYRPVMAGTVWHGVGDKP